MPKSQVDQVLLELGLQQYANSFKENSIESVHDLKLLSTQDLKEIGLVKIGERNRLKSWIDMQNTNGVRSGSTNPFDDHDDEAVAPPFSRSTSTNPFDSDDDDDNNVLITTKTENSNNNNAPPIQKSTSSLPPPPPAYEDDEDEFDDEQALNSALAAMDIDSDFRCWKSFRSSNSISMSSRDFYTPSESLSIPEETGLSEADEQDLRYWKLRLERSEVYSHRYRPVPREERELEELAAFLGIKKKGTSSPGGGLLNLVPTMKRQESGGRSKSTANNNNNNHHSNTLAVLFSGEPPHSILLKRGPVLFRLHKDAAEVLNKEKRGGALWKGDERELILLTHGFILAQVVSPQKSPSGRLLNLVRRTYDQCDVYTNVKSVRDTSSGEAHRFLLELTNQTAVEFQCATEFHQEAWLDGLERVIVEAYIHSSIDTNRAMGWQHKVMRTSLYSDAVLGKARALKKRIKKSFFIVNNLDKYHKMSALHYATQRNHLECMRVLLEAGADVNIQDGEDFLTPMYYAQREGMVDAMELLKQYGAKASRQAEMEQRGELFANARVVERERNEKGRIQDQRVNQAHSRTKSAQGTMSENMSALHERGQKIEKLGEKTANLQSGAASYADYAKQLKEKTKKQSRWGF